MATSVKNAPKTDLSPEAQLKIDTDKAPEATPVARPHTEPIAGLISSFAFDESRITEPKKAAELFARFETVAHSWVDAFRTQGTATGQACRLSWELRTLCVNQNGSIDWAGQSFAYKTVYTERVSYMLLKAGWTTDEVRLFTTAVNTWDADNDFGKLFMAEHRVESDDKFKSLRGKFVAAVDASERKSQALTADLAKALRAEASTQKTASGKQHRKFQDVAKFASAGDVPGQTKAKRNPPQDKGNASDRTLMSTFQRLRNLIGKRTEEGARTVAPYVVSEELHRLVSSFAVLIVGPVGDKAPTGAPKDKIKTVANIEETRDLLTGLLRAMDSDNKQDKSETIGPHLWNDAVASK